MKVLRVLGSLAAVLLLVGCSAEEENPARRSSRGGTATDGASGGGAGGGAGGAAGAACPVGTTAPVQIAAEPGATDVHIAGEAVYFQIGARLVRRGLDGSAASDVYSSEDLVRAYTNGTAVVAVESPDPPNAVLRIGAVGQPREEMREVGTDLTAASVVVFGEDDAFFYLVADNAGGDVLYRIGKQEGGLETIAETDGVVSDPQIAGGAAWYVKNQTEITKLSLDGGEPALVATVPEGCGLAVGSTHLYCSADGAVHQRDLSGGNPRKLRDAQSSSVPVAFGDGLASGDTLLVRSSGDGPLKSVLRSVSPSAESVVACGRDPIGAISASANAVVWIETGKGVFSAPLR